MEMNIIPEQLILQLDFNYNTLIERAIRLNALKTVKHFLKFIQRSEKSWQYQNLIMFELQNLHSQNQLDFNFFYQES